MLRIKWRWLFRIWMAIILVTFSIFGYSQEGDTLKGKRIIITTSVLDYIPNRLNAGNFNIGTDIYLKDMKSFYAGIGVIKSYGQAIGWGKISSLSTVGIKIQVECRHYLDIHKICEPAILLFWPLIFQYESQTLENTGYYIAAHSFCQLTATNRQETVVDYIDNNPSPNTEHHSQNIYTVNRNVYGLNFKFGYQCIKKCGFTIDYCIGLGAQYISSSSANRIGSGDGWPYSQKDFPGNKLFDSGAGISPSIIYQVRLGWGF